MTNQQPHADHKANSLIEALNASEPGSPERRRLAAELAKHLVGFDLSDR